METISCVAMVGCVCFVYSSLPPPKVSRAFWGHVVRPDLLGDSGDGGDMSSWMSIHSPLKGCLLFQIWKMGLFRVVTSVCYIFWGFPSGWIFLRVLGWCSTLLRSRRILGRVARFWFPLLSSWILRLSLLWFEPPFYTASVWFVTKISHALYLKLMRKKIIKGC